MRDDKQDWLAMATAPKDGTLILVVPDGIFDRASFRDGHWFWSTADGARNAAGMVPKGWKPLALEQMAMLVFCRNAVGAPDVFETQVQCTRERIAAGDHYELACDAARASGYDPVLAADQTDPAYRAFFAPKQVQGLEQQSEPSAGRTRYVCDVTVADPKTGQADTLEVHFDESSGAMFAVDATYLDQVRDHGVSPYSGADIVLSEPPACPQPDALQVALPLQDLQALGSELRAARLELVECYRWASTQSANFQRTGQARPMEPARLGSLKARAESIESMLERLAVGQNEAHGQIVSVSGDADDPAQDVVVEVYAFVEGGVVQGVTANVPVKVTVVDYDVEGGDGDHLVGIANEQGGYDDAEVHAITVKVDPSACAELGAMIAQSDVRPAEGSSQALQRARPGRERGG